MPQQKEDSFEYWMLLPGLILALTSLWMSFGSEEYFKYLTNGKEEFVFRYKLIVITLHAFVSCLILVLREYTLKKIDHRIWSALFGCTQVLGVVITNIYTCRRV